MTFVFAAAFLLAGPPRFLGPPEKKPADGEPPAATILPRLKTVSSFVISTSFSTRGFRFAISRSQPLSRAAVHTPKSAPRPELSTCVTLLKSSTIL